MMNMRNPLSLEPIFPLMTKDHLSPRFLLYPHTNYHSTKVLADTQGLSSIEAFQMLVCINCEFQSIQDTNVQQQKYCCHPSFRSTTEIEVEKKKLSSDKLAEVELIVQLVGGGGD